jgi:alpha-glucosidase (family GH31 glycosyl hydrolase)
MLGQDLLVAPVVEEGARHRSIYLPKLPHGLKWLDFYTRTAYESGMTHRLEAPLSQLPILVRQGARLEVAAPRPGLTARHDDPVTEVISF